MSHKLFGLPAAFAVLLLAGCGSSNSNNTANTSASPSASATAAASASPSGLTVAVTVDPCQVVTAAEASQVAGASYSTGKEETTSGGGKICWYGAQTKNVFEVIVVQASSATVAQAYWDAEKSQLAGKIAIGDISIAGTDRAAAGTVSESLNGHSLGGTAIYTIKGAIFFAIVDLVSDAAPPSISTVQTQVETSLGRLP